MACYWVRLTASEQRQYRPLLRLSQLCLWSPPKSLHRATYIRMYAIRMSTSQQAPLANVTECNDEDSAHERQRRLIRQRCFQPCHFMCRHLSLSLSLSYSDLSPTLPVQKCPVWLNISQIAVLCRSLHAIISSKKQW